MAKVVISAIIMGNDQNHDRSGNAQATSPVSKSAQLMQLEAEDFKLAGGFYGA
jgi:hypothetical protein